MAAHDSQGYEKKAPLRGRSEEQSAPETEAVRPAHPLLRLQSQIGNAQVARMIQLQREAALQREDEDEIQPKRDTPVQREDEDEIQTKRDTPVQREDEDEIQTKRDTPVQREDEDEIQTKRDGAVQLARDEGPEVGLEGGPVSAETQQAIQSQRGQGSPLSEGVRSQMEGAFGTSFEDVRLHTDSSSQAINRSLSAKAFTTGSDIFFGQNGNPGDTSLLAHELTHVVQQREGRVQTSGSGMEVTAAGDQGEQEADAMAAKVVSRTAEVQREGNE